MARGNDQKISNIEMKRQNKIRIAKYIYKHGEVSKQEIAQDLGYSMPTVLQRVKDLMEEGIIEEVGEYESTGGRKAKALAIADDRHCAAGMDITRNHVSFVLLNVKGEVLNKKRIRCRFEAEEGYYRELAGYLETFLDKCEADRTKLLGVGISIPGIVDETADRMLQSHVLHLENYDLKELARYIPYPVSFRNDASSAAYAELRGSEETSLYVSLSNSVGGAIYRKGEIYDGTNFRAGEFGHMILMPGGRPCYCGKKGCMDPYCNAQVLAANAGGDLEQFFRKLEEGNQQLMSIWREYLGCLAIAISNLRAAFDCEIILGGYVGGFMDRYLGTLEEYLKKYRIFENDRHYVKTGAYKHEAAAIGAGIRLVEDYFDNLP